MSEPDELLAAARDGLSVLRVAAARLQGRLGDSIDTRRLVEDVARVATDLDLLATNMTSAPRGSGERGPDHQRSTDAGYDPAFWADADDDGSEPDLRTGH